MMSYHVNTGSKGCVGMVALLCMLTVAWFPPSQAQEPQISGWGVEKEGPSTLEVTLYKSRVVYLSTPINKVSVGNPEIADVLILRAQQVYVVGKALGTTNVVLWDRANQVIAIINVEVTYDLETLKAKLYELLPNENIKVYSSQGSIVLGGEVSSAVKINAAMELAKSFLSGAPRGKGDKGGREAKVVNLMEVGGAQQVMLEVKVAEMARTLMKTFKVHFFAIDSGGKWKLGAVNGGGTFPNANGGQVFDNGTPIGPLVDQFEPNTLGIEGAGFFAHFLSGDFLFNGVLEAAKETGLAKILAEPTLTTLTGQEAKFISGGEFPVPVPQGNNNGTTIEFKEFGIGLQFVPVVLDSGRISLKLNITVSELTSTASIVLNVADSATDFFVPALTKRAANATVELSDGQTLGIAGLISENLRENANKFPGLGSLPVLGLLFRSQEFVKGKTELVIFVTPHFARPTPPELVKLPTDDFVEPSDAQFYLEGRIEGKKPKPAVEGLQPGGAEGSFGHDV